MTACMLDLTLRSTRLSRVIRAGLHISRRGISGLSFFWGDGKCPLTCHFTSPADSICRQVLALCLTGTNTFTTLLNNEGTSIPAFQTFFTYVLLNIGYTGYTLYRYGFKKWCRLIYKDGWKCEDLCPLLWLPISLILLRFCRPHPFLL